MRNQFDYIAKGIGEEGLRSSGSTFVNDVINPETQYADLRHEPDPARHTERARLGLLGRLAAFACLIEVYSEAPNGEEFRACLSKHFAAWQQRARKARADNKKRTAPPAPEPPNDPFLWIITAGAPTTLLTKLKLEGSQRWPTGVYLFGDEILRVGIVVASELPRDSTTLLVRLMAAGPLLAPAVRELASLPPDAPERVVAEPILLTFQHRLGQSASPTSEEQEFIMAVLKSWEDGKAEARAEGRTEGREEGRTEGREEGRTEGRTEAVLTVLDVRGVSVPDAARQRIQSERDLSVLKRWLEKAVVASSINDVFDGAS
jgi:hypothetical protein